MSAQARPEIVLVRHGETEWSRSGRHTGRTDLPLTDEGRRQAERVGEALAGRAFERVLTSPLQRAADTCRLAGFGAVAELQPDLMEWDYGEYEGRTTEEIRRDTPGWTIFRIGAPGGETAEQIGARADRVIAVLHAVRGDALVFAHGHLLRVLTARWLGLRPEEGRLFALGTAAICTLGWERETATIRRWGVSAG